MENAFGGEKVGAPEMGGWNELPNEAWEDGQRNGQEQLAQRQEVENEVAVFSGAETDTQRAPELKPLAADGSTEGKLGKLAVQLSGDVMTEDSAREVRNKLQEFKDNPFELQNYRDEAMVESLRDNYGRIFGDDGNENEGGSEVA